MLDLHVEKHGYIEVSPPHVVQLRQSLFGTGQLPKLEGDMYRIEDEDLLLNPTAEVPVTNIYRDEILEPGMVPRYLTAYCPSYRREAGAYGKDTRGIDPRAPVRQGRAGEVRPARDQLRRAREAARATSEAVLRGARAAVPRRCCCAAATLSFAAAKCYDFEVWAPGAGPLARGLARARNFEDFQARRAGMRFRREAGAKAEFVHTLNASGVALPRHLRRAAREPSDRARDRADSRRARPVPRRNARDPARLKGADMARAKARASRPPPSLVQGLPVPGRASC